MAHSAAIQGPTATTTCSTSIEPGAGGDAATAPELVEREAVTSTPSAISAPAARALEASPSIDSRLNAKPPGRSCRQTVSPRARQSPNSARMWAPTSSSPTISSDG